MKQYYLKNGSRESGPYLLDDLKYQRISSSSLIKVDDGNWEPITKNKDLRFLLESGEGNGSSGSSVFDNRNRDSRDESTVSAENSKKIIAVAIAIFLAVMGFSIAFFLAAGK